MSTSGGPPQHPPAAPSGPAPLPSNSEPFPISCSCFNITINARVPDKLLGKLEPGSEAFENDTFEPVYLPANAESIKHIELSTFQPVVFTQSFGSSESFAWRRCWACGVRVYKASGVTDGDIAPSDAWVEVAFGDGVLFGKALEDARHTQPLPFSGLHLDIPKTSNFGRPPTVNTVTPYPPASAPTQSSSQILVPIPDPFFLPPPFIPNHPVLREICKQAVAALNERHAEIEADIQQYIHQRAADMFRIEDQVRAEVEALWARWARGPGAGQQLDRRRGSVMPPDVSISSPSVPRVKFDPEMSKGPGNANAPASQVAEEIKEMASEADKLSGVTFSPKPTGVTAAGTVHAAATGGASLLAASLSANAFHAPPRTASVAPATATLDEDEFENLTKTASNDQGVDREVAMSYAFSAMEEHASAVASASKGTRQREKEKHREQRAAEQVEEGIQDDDKGIDSWINIERAQVQRKIETELKDEKNAEASLHHAEATANGEESKGSDPTQKRAKVTFQEPFQSSKTDAEEPSTSAAPSVPPGDDDFDDVFDFEDDKPKAPIQPQEPVVSNRTQRTMVEQNLSRTFAADAPSHRAAWRKFEARGSISSVLQEHKNKKRVAGQPDDLEDLDEADETWNPPDDGLARSVPVNVVKKRATIQPGVHAMQLKTSLTDREGVWVPNLIKAMRERPTRGVLESFSPNPSDSDNSRRPSDDSTPVATVTRGTRSGSIAIQGPPPQLHGSHVRRGSRSASGEREREQVKSYAADPGAVFESLAETAVDSDEDEDEEGEGTVSENVKFVPPHVLAQRSSSKPEVGWRSLAA